LRLERILGSPGRIRLLKTILSYGQINITRLTRETGLHYRLVSKYLADLEEEGIVTIRRVGRLKIVEANLYKPEVALLRDLLEAAGE
jgi:DNA-binding transcriptional ArsR family regulator